MKRLILFLLAILPLAIQAQTDLPTETNVEADSVPVVRFGYLSYDQTLKTIKAYAEAQQQIEEQRIAYKAEMKRVEDDFNQKYEAFLEGQNEFPRTILLKRQNELKELMQRNMEFKAQARRDLQEAEKEALKPVRAKLNKILATIAREFGFALIINTDANACPFIDPVMGKDIQGLVTEYLNMQETGAEK